LIILKKKIILNLVPVLHQASKFIGLQGQAPDALALALKELLHLTNLSLFHRAVALDDGEPAFFSKKYSSCSSVLGDIEGKTRSNLMIWQSLIQVSWIYLVCNIQLISILPSFNFQASGAELLSSPLLQRPSVLWALCHVLLHYLIGLNWTSFSPSDTLEARVVWQLRNHNRLRQGNSGTPVEATRVTRPLWTLNLTAALPVIW
jgi:hypothetical protein